MQAWEERVYEIKEAEERGIKALVLDNLEEGTLHAQIVIKLQKHFHLGEEKANEYVNKFSDIHE